MTAKAPRTPAKTKKTTPKKPLKAPTAGRPSKYNPDFDDLVYKFCLLGATDKELAAFFDVDEATINRWKQNYPTFCESMKKGKEIADSEVANKLYHRACGYTHKELKIATFEGEFTDEKEVDKHYPPDTAAAIFWLKNRRPDRFRDKIDHELAGPGGGPISLEVVSFADAMKDED